MLRRDGGRKALDKVALALNALGYGHVIVRREVRRHRGRKGNEEVKLTTKQNDDLAVRKGKDKEGRFVELLTEDSQYILTPMEAERIGNALIKAAQPKKQREAGKSDGRLARLARNAYAHCQQKGWSRDWREAGCYLHLEASEFTEALRGKGDCEQEAADVLFVLLSTMEAHNIGVDWVLEILEQRLKDAPTEAQKEQRCDE